jgi:hypothetical protein
MVLLTLEGQVKQCVEFVHVEQVCSHFKHNSDCKPES